MSDKPSPQNFKGMLEELFGQSLTPDAELAANDFLHSWDDLIEGFKKDSIQMTVDMLFLSKNFPEYGQYKVWKGFGTIVFLAGLILLFILWKIAIAVIIIGFGLNIYSNTAKSSGGQKFTEEIKQELNSNSSKCMAKICSHYIAGSIQLESQDGQAHWPAYPSSVFGGETRFIRA
jgi:hypothetical protein